MLPKKREAGRSHPSGPQLRASKRSAVKANSIQLSAEDKGVLAEIRRISDLLADSINGAEQYIAAGDSPYAAMCLQAVTNSAHAILAYERTLAGIYLRVLGEAQRKRADRAGGGSQ